MPAFDLPDLLKTALATSSLEAIGKARSVLAGESRQLQDARAAQTVAHAATIVSTKPVALWTPENHVAFMDALGDASPPAPLTIRVPASAQKPTTLQRAPDDEIPF